MKPLIAAVLLIGLTIPAFAAAPTVLELFTSQSCSSCPPADALLQKLASDPGVLALSYHVTYWDGLGWKDPFSLPAGTERQRSYTAVLGGGVYTPELVIDGAQQHIGSRDGEVTAALGKAKQQAKTVAVDVAKSNNQLAIDVGAGSQPADIWLVTYNPKAVTAIRGGENRDETLTSINNVTAIAHLGMLGAQPQSLQSSLSADPADRYAVLVQSPQGGPILGAGVAQ